MRSTKDRQAHSAFRAPSEEPCVGCVKHLLYVQYLFFFALMALMWIKSNTNAIGGGKKGLRLADLHATMTAAAEVRLRPRAD